jgi:hypothetical protein
MLSIFLSKKWFLSYYHIIHKSYIIIYYHILSIFRKMIPSTMTPIFGLFGLLWHHQTSNQRLTSWSFEESLQYQWWYFPCQQQIFGSGVNHYLAKLGHHWNSRISGMATLIFRWNNHNLELAIFNYNISQCESIKRVEITNFQILLTLNPNIRGSSKHFLFTSPCIKHVFWVKSPFFASNLTRPSCFFVPFYQHYEKGFPANVLFNQFRNLQVTSSKKNHDYEHHHPPQSCEATQFLRVQISKYTLILI